MPERESHLERTGKHRALVVDDSPEVVEVVKRMLERALPVHVDMVGSAADALVKMAEHEYDTIISDYTMPGMNGLDLLRSARQLSPSTPRIMLTGATDFDLAVNAINDGAITAFLPKPVDSKTLVEKVRAALESRHQAYMKERGSAQAAQLFRREMNANLGKDVPRPFTGALGDSTRR